MSEDQMPDPLAEQKEFLESRAETDKVYANELHSVFDPFYKTTMRLVAGFIAGALKEESDGKLKARMQVVTHVLCNVLGGLEQSALDLGVPREHVDQFREMALEEGRRQPILEKKDEELATAE